jgi:hypothetical protein
MEILQSEVKQTIRKLNRLAKVEYLEDLASIMGSPKKGGSMEDRAARQLGRLVGIEMKRPFARPVRLESPSPYSGAYRGWNLYTKKVFDKRYQAFSGLPEGQPLELVIESFRSHSVYVPDDVYAIAQEVHHEWGWLRELVVWLRPRVCEDRALFNKLRTALGDAGSITIDLSIATQVANLLVTVPLLSGVPMTVLVGISLFIIRQGADSFCEWAKRQEKEQVQLGMIER